MQHPKQSLQNFIDKAYASKDPVEATVVDSGEIKVVKFDKLQYQGEFVLFTKMDFPSLYQYPVHLGSILEIKMKYVEKKEGEPPADQKVVK